MAAQPTVLYLDPDDEIVLALKRAAREHQLILVKSGDDVFEISDVSAYAAERDEETVVTDSQGTDVAVADNNTEEPDAILGLIGIFSSGEPDNDVAQDKYRYLADAYLPDQK